MKKRENYMVCSDCGLFCHGSKMFVKIYQNTAICLCKKCALKLHEEILDYEATRSLEKECRK